MEGKMAAPDRRPAGQAAVLGGDRPLATHGPVVFVME
jgi:hypothetical protein